ncbi:MAG: flavodoxin family protein [Thermoplasmata archaeon HGW-Thermoplasmata-1]|nr:MAG: flavodoxin family protein [Thermoplasmata archaeon HGW-Thermoplasmata-1]
MRIIVFNASPKAEQSATHFMAEPLLEGAAGAGAEVENVFLSKKNIRHCIGCFDCWFKTPGACCIKDDMGELLSKFSSADIAVFASPLYVDNVSGLMKTFIDRLIPLVDCHFSKDESGECRHGARIAKYPRIAVMSNAGFPEIAHFQVLSHYFKRMARNMHSEVVAEIYRGAGPLLTSGLPIAKPFVSAYRRLLVQAGAELAESAQISPKTQRKLDRPLVPDILYIKGVNHHFDAELSKIKLPDIAAPEPQVFMEKASGP